MLRGSNGVKGDIGGKGQGLRLSPPLRQEAEEMAQIVPSHGKWHCFRSFLAFVDQAVSISRTKSARYPVAYQEFRHLAANPSSRPAVFGW